ncbi:MAG: hypothetical protein ACYDER_03755 [Ktedonobacteraceae bacterium]
MLPAFSDFFGTTFTDNLGKFLQPTYIVISALFLLLNLLFIVPPLAAQNVMFASQLSSMDSNTKTIVGIAAILVVAYIFLSLNKVTLRIMTGEAWMFTLLGDVCIKLQKRRRDKLMKASNISGVRGLAERLAFVTDFPEEDGYLEPTALGNVLNATASYIWQHYGIDMVALWPHMNTAIGTDSTLSSSVTNEKSTLDFLVNLSFILILFSLELLLMFLKTYQFGVRVLWVLLPLALSYAVYQTTVIQARTWGDVVQEAFDLHRKDLKTNLGLRDFTSQEDERQVWRKVSAWLLWGNPADDCFADQSAPATPTVTCSNNIKIAVQTMIVEASSNKQEFKQEQSTMFGFYQIFQYTQYMLFVSSTGTSDKTGLLAGAYAFISDTQVPVPDTQVAVIDEPTYAPSNSPELHPEIIRSDDPTIADGLLWTIKHLHYDGATMIRYSVPGLYCIAYSHDSNIKITKDNDDVQANDTGAIDYTFTITNNGSSTKDDVTITIIDTRRTMPDYDKYGCLWKDSGKDLEVIVAAQVSNPNGYQWQLGTLAAHTEVKLQYTL